MWDIMEPWVITDFGSNVAGEENSVRVPARTKAWYGSHQSGTYGVLGADLAWEQVEAGQHPPDPVYPRRVRPDPGEHGSAEQRAHRGGKRRPS